MDLTIKTGSRTEMIDITSKVQEAINGLNATSGICMIYVPHTTAAVTINESADPAVKADILMVLNKVIPWKENYRHLEGNSPAHLKSSIIGASELVAVENGRLSLGTWQGIFFCEFDGPRNRKFKIKYIGA